MREIPSFSEVLRPVLVDRFLVAQSFGAGRLEEMLAVSVGKFGRHLLSAGCSRHDVRRAPWQPGRQWTFSVLGIRHGASTFVFLRLWIPSRPCAKRGGVPSCQAVNFHLSSGKIPPGCSCATRPVRAGRREIQRGEHRSRHRTRVGLEWAVLAGFRPAPFILQRRSPRRLLSTSVPSPRSAPPLPILIGCAVCSCHPRYLSV